MRPPVLSPIECGHARSSMVLGRMEIEMADLRDAKFAALNDLYVAISAEVANIPKITSTASRARALADLALAYRYAEGGSQPGSVTVEK